MKKSLRITLIVAVSLLLMLCSSAYLAHRARQVVSTPFISVKPTGSAAHISPEGCAHEWSGGFCTICGAECQHDWKDGVCAICGYPCPHVRHDPQTRICAVCEEKVRHSYVDCVCSCGVSPEFIYDKKDFPLDILDGTEHGGELTQYVFDVGDGVVTEGERTVSTERGFIVYTPYGYDPSRKYDVLLLSHAAGNDCRDWLTKRHIFSVNHPYVYGRSVLDAMIDHGYTEPLIVVSVEYRSHGRPAEATIPFEEELRSVVLPFVIANYGTYASLDENGVIVPARRHFAFAGASFGSMMIWEGMIDRCGDLFAYWGCFSGNVTTEEEMVEEINSAAERGYTPDFLYASGGDNEISTRSEERRINAAIESCDFLLDGGNAMFLELKGGDHNYSSWNVSLYNCLQVFFQNIHAG